MKHIFAMRPKPLIKIGLSTLKHPAHAKRYDGLVLMEDLYSIPSADAYAILAAVHKALAAAHCGGDWFDVSPEAAIEAIEAATIKICGKPRTVPGSVSALLDALQGSQTRDEFADEMGTGYWRVTGWKRMDAIPRKHWDKILKIAKTRGRADITLDLLERLSPRKAKPAGREAAR